MWIDHYKKIQKLTFWVLALRRSKSDSLRWKATARNVSFRIFSRWPIHNINPVDKTKLSHVFTHVKQMCGVQTDGYAFIVIDNYVIIVIVN